MILNVQKIDTRNEIQVIQVVGNKKQEFSKHKLTFSVNVQKLIWIATKSVQTSCGDWEVGAGSTVTLPLYLVFAPAEEKGERRPSLSAPVR